MLLASGDAASGLINPNLPQLLPAAAVASLAVGATLNTMILPQLGQVKPIIMSHLITSKLFSNLVQNVITFHEIALSYTWSRIQVGHRYKSFETQVFLELYLLLDQLECVIFSKQHTKYLK